MLRILAFAMLFACPAWAQDRLETYPLPFYGATETMMRDRAKNCLDDCATTQQACNQQCDARLRIYSETRRDCLIDCMQRSQDCYASCTSPQQQHLPPTP